MSKIENADGGSGRGMPTLAFSDNKRHKNQAEQKAATKTFRKRKKR